MALEFQLVDKEDKSFEDGYAPLKSILLKNPKVAESVKPVILKAQESVKEKRSPFVKIAEAMSPSDLAGNLAILQHEVQKAFSYSFQNPQRNPLQVSKERFVENMRDIRIYRTDEVEDLEQVLPGANYKGTSFGDSYFDVGIKKYGRRFPVLWETLLNDNAIGEFNDLKDKMVRAGMRTKFKLFTNKFAANTTFFSVGNGNLMANGELGSETLEEAIRKMETQQDSKGNTLDIVAKFLMVPTALKLTAQTLVDPMLLQQLNVAKLENARRAFDVTPIINPFLDGISDKGWYLFADPSQLEALTHLSLNGHPGIELLMKKSDQESLVGAISDGAMGLGSFDNDTIDIKVRMFFESELVNPEAAVYSTGNA